ncbi:MAG: DUF3793 family protein [Lachnospiraceae bacterium]|nr:DUF3793 family protein [Lachnospiraceae bacterium]
MPEELIIANCSPTLAGIKTGSLFSMKISEGTDLFREARELNFQLRKKGLLVIPVKKTEELALIYLYRPKDLSRDLKHPWAAKILKKTGYCSDDPENCLVRLIRRLREEDVFPHEIGLFLGYPPSDVESFMEHPCKGVKFCGYWKAYSHPEVAEKTFRRFRMCTEAYREMHQKGKSLTQLAVATTNRVG